MADALFRVFVKDMNAGSIDGYLDGVSRAGRGSRRNSCGELDLAGFVDHDIFSLGELFIDYNLVGDEIKIDYFAVSVPDLLIFEENLNERNRKHCLFMMSLGLRGLGQTDEAKACAEELLSMDNAHQGIRVHDL